MRSHEHNELGCESLEIQEMYTCYFLINSVLVRAELADPGVSVQDQSHRESSWVQKQ